MNRRDLFKVTAAAAALIFGRQPQAKREVLGGKCCYLKTEGETTTFRNEGTWGNPKWVRIWSDGSSCATSEAWNNLNKGKST